VNTMRGLSTVLAGLILGAASLCATGCAADADLEPQPAPKEFVDQAPVNIPETNQVPEAPPSTQTTGATSTTPSGAPLAPAQPRLSPKK